MRPTQCPQKLSCIGQGKIQMSSQVNEANSMSPEIVMYRIFSAAKRECRVRGGGFAHLHIKSSDVFVLTIECEDGCYNILICLIFSINTTCK